MKHTLKIFAILALMLVATSQVWGQSTLRIRTGSITDGCSLEYYSDQNCTTPVDASDVAAGSTTYIKAIPDESHTLSGITITVEPTVGSIVARAKRRVTSNSVDLGDYIEVTAIGNGVYCFLMPADENLNVRVSATFPEKGGITPVVSISGWTYGDAAHQPTVSGNTGNGTVTYTYSDAQNGTYTETVPTEAGTYWVKAAVAKTADYYAGVSEPVSFVIAQKAVNVTITGHHALVEWDGEEHNVSGYDFSADTPLYTEAFFTFSGTATATRTDYGTTTMGLDASQFENTNDNFTVTFHVTDGWLTICIFVTFDANGHGTAPDNQYVFLGDYATVPAAPSVNGYSFGGWYTTAECSGDAYDFSNTPVNGPLTLYAKWTLKVYTISYNLNGGSANNPTTYTIESEAITLVNPTLESCVFLGWTGTGLNGATMTVTIPTGSTGDREYTATWLQMSTDTYLAYNTTTQEFETLTAPLYTTVTSGTTTMNNGWYAVKENITINSRITVTGTVNLVLFDGATLTASQGLNVAQGVTLNIFGQTNGTGVLTATDVRNGYVAAIGGGRNENGGTVTIHGGTVMATASDYGDGAAIGGGYKGSGGTVTIYGGTVTATVGKYGAAIGGGSNGNGGTVTIHGGSVTATVGEMGSAAAIGGGRNGNGGTVTIHGGSVTATVGEMGSGAGIGGGRNGNGGTVTIYGGTVMATASDWGDGAAIGGGYYGNGGTVTIHGGTVTTKVGEMGSGAAIGGGYSGSGGTLNLGDMRVYTSANATTPVASTDRESTCRSKYAKLERCTDHNGKNGYCTYCDAHVILVNNDAEAAAGEKNTDVISTWNDTETDIILQGRTLYKDGDWNTLCLPFNLGDAEAEAGHHYDDTPLEGATVMTLESTEFEAGLLTMTFADATSIEAGKPYIVKWTTTGDNLVNPVFRGGLIRDAAANVSTTYADFVGSYAPITGEGLLLDAHNPNGDAMHAALGINEPAQEGYIFVGWYTDVALTTPATTIPFAADGNVTLYAKWIPQNYTVRFNKNHDDASGTMADQPFTNGAKQALTANAFTAPTGYMFVGWSTTTDGEVEYTDGQIVSNLATIPDAVVNLYAIWGYAYTINYDLAGGNADNPTYYSELSDAITLVNPTRTGYTFTGWTGTDLEEPTMTVTIPAGSTGNREYTATWSPKAYNITYNFGGGTLPEGESNPTSYNIESADITLVNPVREDYTFLGWTGSNGNVPQTSVTIATGSTGDLFYNANWIQYSTDTYLAYNITTQEFETLTVPVYTTVTSGTTTMSNDWYAVKENVTISSRITVTGTVNLVLFDGATLEASQGLNVPLGVTLNIFGQTNGTGVLTASCGDNYVAAIGGNDSQSAGTVIIHGSTVTTTVGEMGYGAGIGGGRNGSGGIVTIYGGTVTATVGKHGHGAGIGGGRNGNGGTVTIYGGTVTATVGDYGDGAAIGGGRSGSDGTVTIHGGSVTATVGEMGSGAGIGGGRNGNGGTVTIYGGTVMATASDWGDGAAIGGGYYGNGGTVTIHGGTVTTKVGEMGSGAAIGGGYSGSGGTLNLGDMRVYTSANATTPVASTDRESTCRSKYAKLERCTDHNGKNGYCTYCDAHVILVNNDAEAAAGEKNTDVISTWNDTETDIILQGRTLYKDGDWNTLCLPFNLGDAEAEAGHHFDGTPLEGAVVKELNASTSNLTANGTLTLNFTDADAIEAGKPYIGKWENASGSVSNPVFTGVTISSTTPTPVEFSIANSYDKCEFVGQYSSFNIVTSDATGDGEGNLNEIIMLSSGSRLGYSKNPRTLNTFRCHFYVPAKDGVQQARAFVMDFGEETTGVVSIDHSPLTIDHSADAWYDMQGRKVANGQSSMVNGQWLKKGVYIVNGKKVKR